MQDHRFGWIALVLCCGLLACERAGEQGDAMSGVPFTEQKIIDSARYWWALTVADVTNDGLADLVFIDNNSSGGYLGYYTGQQAGGTWQLTVVAEEPPSGGTFASGDLETGDIDGDGDEDILGVKHTGEWDDAGAPAELYWYENPTWEAHRIGTAPDAVKDLSLADINGDFRLDLAVLTFDQNSLSIFIQDSTGRFVRVQYLGHENLHEGMDVGDVDGDGFVDIATNGYYFKNPGENIKELWRVFSIDRKWHRQEGDWSANGTKVACRDIDDDGMAEVFISHSERAGYPVAWYDYTEGAWTENIIADSLPACHTLQVFDLDLDGDQDVIAGINWARAINLDIDRGDVIAFINEGDNLRWSSQLISEGGIYNGRVIDFEGDGDYDLFRLPNHEARQVFLHINGTK